jgi:hypothetical protein
MSSNSLDQLYQRIIMLELGTKLAAMKAKVDTMKPSDWLQAMIDGLRQAKADPYYKVDMKSYGHWTSGGELKNPEMCFGCAATATLMLMIDTPYMALVKDYGQSVSDSSSYVDLLLYAVDYNSEIDLARTETAIDYARNGTLNPLFRLCSIPPMNVLQLNNSATAGGWNNRFLMTNKNWEAEIPKVEELITEMKTAGY